MTTFWTCLAVYFACGIGTLFIAMQMPWDTTRFERFLVVVLWPIILYRIVVG